MKYYCGNCGDEWNTMKIDYSRCPFCKHEGLVVEVPTHEPVAQLEKRTGRKYPDTAPVYVWMEVYNDWGLYTYGQVKGHLSRRYGTSLDSFMCIVATELGAPDNSWRPK
jgi:DNA-directed RNA polymerase subunit RPC12/RpoP